MNLSFTLATFALLASTASALLDCGVPIARQQSGLAGLPRNAVCDHFAGGDLTGYHQWYDNNQIASKYPSMVFLPGSDPLQPQNGAAVHWKADKEYVYLAVAARATGWLAFGIGEAGGMNGADLAMFTAIRPDELVDGYTTDDRMPKVDECSQDWELVSSDVDLEGGFLMFEMKRKLDTGDAQDKVIVDDTSKLIPPHRVIAAWGDSEEVGYHGLNRARGAIRFFGVGDEQSIFEAAMDENAEGSFEVRSMEHPVAVEETEYAYTCVTKDDLLRQGVPDSSDPLNIIGFEPIIEEKNRPFVHHFIVRASSSPDFCADGERGFEEIGYAWAPGEDPLTLPNHLGAPLMGPDGYQAFEIEVHYNNPTLINNIIDNSGVRFYWTSQPRQFEMGILTVGDPGVQLYGEPVGQGHTLHQFECPGSCSSLVNQPVTVLREHLHMHEIGARMTNEQIRNGEVIRSGNIEYWEFDQNGAAAAQQDAFQILPGDGFRTSCYYQDEDDRVFGLASAEEMCMAFLYYYPRVTIKASELANSMGASVEDIFGGYDGDFHNASFPWTCGYGLGLPMCDTAHSFTQLDSAEDYNRQFGMDCGDGAESVEESGAVRSTVTGLAAGLLLMAVSYFL